MTQEGEWYSESETFDEKLCFVKTQAFISYCSQKLIKGLFLKYFFQKITSFNFLILCWKDFLTLPYIFQSWIIISVFVITSAFHLGCIRHFLKNIFQAFLSLPVSFNNFLFFVFFLINLFHVFLDSPQVKLPLTWKVLNLSNQMFSSIPIFHTLNISSCYYYFSIVLSASKQLLPLGQTLHIHLTIVSL